MTQESNALRLADELDVGDFDVLTNYAAAAELRRLHEENQKLTHRIDWWQEQHDVTVEAHKRPVVQSLQSHARRARAAIAKHGGRNET